MSFLINGKEYGLDDVEELAKDVDQLTAENAELRSKLEQAEDDADQDWMNAIQSIDWGGEISLAEGNDCAPDARKEVIDSIYQRLVEAQLAKEQSEAKVKVYEKALHELARLGNGNSIAQKALSETGGEK